MTTSIQPTTLFPRRQRRKKRKGQQKILKHILKYFKKCAKMTTSESGKLKHNLNFLTVNCGTSPVQEHPGCLHVWIQLSLIKSRTVNRFVGIFYPSLFILPAVQHSQKRPCLCSSNMLTSTLPTLQPFYYTKQTWQQQVFVLFNDSSRQVKTKISQQIQVKKQSVLLEPIFIYPAYLGIIHHISKKNN